MPAKKKILFVITKSNWGGAQRYVFDLATNLPKDEFEAIVALGGTGGKDEAPGKLEQKLKEAHIRTIFVKSFMRDISILKELGALRELVKIFGKEKPEVVHLNSSKAGVIGALAARLTGVKNIVFTSHGWAFNEDRGWLVLQAIKFLQWLNIILSHKTICVSNSDANQVRHWPFVSRKIFTVHNGISQITFGSGDKIRSAFPSGVIITGTIGELNRNKNQKALIEEAKNTPDMYVAIIGEGEDRNMLEDKIKKYGLEDRVKLFGFVPASEALPGFDRFAITSIKEGLPYVVIEAKQAGLPIVANRVGGIEEILDNSDPEEFTLKRMLEKTEDLYNS